MVANYEGTVHRADGRVEKFPVDMPEGFWNPGADALEFYRGSGWQNVDEEHPEGGGKPAYRVAYKTLRLVPTQDISLVWPNLQVKFRVGELNCGGFQTPEGIPSRKPNMQVVPEYGIRIPRMDGAPHYLNCPNPNMGFAAWERNIKALTYVEIIRLVEESTSESPDDMLNDGRAGVAPIKTILDLAFGPRLLGLPLLEEIGEVFEDGHWNRRLDSVRLGTELQLRPTWIDASEFLERLRPRIENNQSLSEVERRRFRLASQWYWLADAEVDGANRFIHYWLVIESLEMETKNIGPVKDRLVVLLGQDTERVRNFVGQLYATRGSLVHGNLLQVTKEQLERVEALARLLLLARIGDFQSEQELQLIRSWVQ